MRTSIATLWLLGALIVVSCSGCAAFLPRRTTPPEGEIPERFSLGDAEVLHSNRWWMDFDSQELSDMIDAAMCENLTLRQLWARLDQAHSAVIISASGLYPQLDLGADARYNRTVTEIETATPSLKSRLRDAVVSGVTRGIRDAINQTPETGSTGGTGNGDYPTEPPPTRITTETRRFSLSLAASYELDIWGRIASEYHAARFDYDASREDLESVAMTLAAEVADRWLRILEQHELKRLLSEQLATNKTYLELVELRFRKNQVSALDVYQQRQVVSEVERQIPLVESQEQVLRHDLAVLLGRLPTAPLKVGTYNLALVPAPPGTGIPADLLVRRPDVRGVLAQLNAADYRVASARADRLPAIRLTGGIGYDTGKIENLFDDWFLSLAAGLTAPLFDGFRREAEVDRTLAVVEERLAAYRLTVLTAIKEVEDALVREQKQREHLEGLVRQLQDASDALREASERYRKGLSDYLPVLTALERTQALARGLVIARRELLITRVDLYRALGGTWTQELSAPTRLSDEAAVAEDSKS